MKNYMLTNTVYAPVRNVCVRGANMGLKVRKLIVRLRMWYADIRGHHGMRWNYEPGDHYMRGNKNKRK